MPLYFGQKWLSSVGYFFLSLNNTPDCMFFTRTNGWIGEIPPLAGTSFFVFSIILAYQRCVLKAPIQPRHVWYALPRVFKKFFHCHAIMNSNTVIQNKPLNYVVVAPFCQFRASFFVIVMVKVDPKRVLYARGWKRSVRIALRDFTVRL